MPLHSL